LKSELEITSKKNKNLANERKKTKTRELSNEAEKK
jgi:hypothetical protein